VQKKQAFEMLPLKNGIKWAVQEGWGATPFCKTTATAGHSGLVPNPCPECTPFFLYRGKETLKINNITCLPCDIFLKHLTPDNKSFVPLFLPS
jgi:hypothetical protein